MKKLWKFGKFHHHQLSIQEVGFIKEIAVLETQLFPWLLGGKKSLLLLIALVFCLLGAAITAGIGVYGIYCLEESKIIDLRVLPPQTDPPPIDHVSQSD